MDHSDRLKEQGGLLTSEPLAVPGDRKVLARRAEGDDIDRLDLPAVDLLDVPEVDHAGEPGLRDGAREWLDLAGPGRYDADRRRRAGTSAGAVEQTAQLHSTTSVLRTLAHRCFGSMGAVVVLGRLGLFQLPPPQLGSSSDHPAAFSETPVSDDRM